MKSVARMKGMVRAVADQNHPLQTILKLILTDFDPNENNQGIPQEEKDNIIRTAQYMPLKINFDGEDYHGHTGAMALGPIVNVAESTINSRQVIVGDAIIWNELYEDISKHLKEIFANGIGTSWEIYYESSELKNGVEWLKGCVFAGTCIVDTPAYGPERTRVLAIAEKITDKLKEANSLLEKTSAADNTPQEETAEDVVEDVAVADVVTDTTVDTINTTDEALEPANPFDDTRDVIDEAKSVLFDLYEGLDALYQQTFTLEQTQKATSIDQIAASFTQMLADLTARFNDLNAAQAELEEVKAETARAQKITSRKLQLIEAGLDDSNWTDREDMYMRMEDDMFIQYITDLVTVSNKPAQAEKDRIKSIKIPEPVHTPGKVTNQDIVTSLYEELKINNNRG